MQVEEQYPEKLNAITHSPYYGCTVRVLSKAQVSYEGVLDGISTNKDRIFLKNVRVNGNITPASNQSTSVNDQHKNNPNDTLNAVMIDHLTNDIRTYEQVCLNVRDIHELRLIELPSTFHESKAKLRAIDPCLVDIRLSPSDEYDTRSNGSTSDYPPRAPIARQRRGESFESNGSSALISSSSNESSSSFGLRSNENFHQESHDESIDDQIEKFRQLTTRNAQPKPVTLLAKKVLPKKIERRADVPSTPTNNHFRPNFIPQRENPQGSNRMNNPPQMKKGLMSHPNRALSPIRVTITSKLNPNAVPFCTQQRNVPAIQNPSFTFYERPRFRPQLPMVTSPDRSQSMPFGINAIQNNQSQQQQQPKYRHTHQRFVPPRQMAMKKNLTQTNPNRSNRTPPPIMKYRIHPSINLIKQSYPQQQQKQTRDKTSNNIPFPAYQRQTPSPISRQVISASQLQERSSFPRTHPNRQSVASIHSTASLPFQFENPSERNRFQASVLFGESFASQRNQRTFSGASSGSSISVDIGPHSIVQFDSLSNPLPSFEEQYDFEKANEEFRRYLELEELVTRCPSSHCSIDSISNDQITPQANSYKKEISFFDRISCTATTGTAVGYTEMDETEKNRETFGDDALLMPSISNDNEWQI